MDGFKVNCLFNNGESRIIDVKRFFEFRNVGKDHLAYPLMTDLKEFKKVELEHGTLVWKNIMFKSKDEHGNEVGYYFDLDPIVLYEAGEQDKDRSIDIGLMIKQARKELGITQEQLAQKSGTTKHYISRIENERSGIELMTLKRIVEGLGKSLKITIN